MRLFLGFIQLGAQPTVSFPRMLLLSVSLRSAGLYHDLIPDFEKQIQQESEEESVSF